MSTLPTTPNPFLDFCVNHNVLRFGSFTLKSGRQSPYFFNMGHINSGKSISELGLHYAKVLIEKFGSTALASGDYVLFGPAYKGIPLVVTIAAALGSISNQDQTESDIQIDIPFFFNRKVAKDHGEGGNLVGYTDLKGKKVIIVDDVITAGTAIREAVDIVNNCEGCLGVAGVVVALDRQEIAPGTNDSESDSEPKLSAIQQVHKEYGFPVYSVANLDELVAYMDSESKTVTTEDDGKGGEGGNSNANKSGSQHSSIVEKMKKYREEYGVKV